MNLSNKQPPHDIHARCVKAFGLTGSKPVFTYGDTIYNPLFAELGTDLIVHEAMHTRQQGDDPQGWWDDYLTVPLFRFRQELEAYQEQYAFAEKVITDRNDLVRFLHCLAADLSSPMYGNLCTLTKARSLIRDPKATV